MKLAAPFSKNLRWESIFQFHIPKYEFWQNNIWNKSISMFNFVSLVVSVAEGNANSS